MSHPSLQIDLTHLFSPAIDDGPKSFHALQSTFVAAQVQVQEMRHKGWMGFADLPFAESIVAEVKAACDAFGFVKNIVVFGIGGSALGAQSIHYALRGMGGIGNAKKDVPRLFILDHIEPNAFCELKTSIDVKETLFVLISKSGDTSETLAQYLFLQANLKEMSSAKIFVITDPDKGYLRALAKEKNWPTLPVPPNVGGRFSVFSAVGLFPLAMAGIDVKALVRGARDMQTFCQKTNLIENPAALVAVAWSAWLVQKNFSQVVMMPYSDRLRYFTDWFAQLFGESLGKNGVGFTPIKAVGVTDQHSQLQLYLEGPRDKIVSFVDVQHYADAGRLGVSDLRDDRIAFLENKTLLALMQAEKLATEESLRANQRPNQTISLAQLDEYALGQLYQLSMNVVVYLGAILQLNPFDQPAVEQIKRLTFALMGRKGFENQATRLRDVQRNPLVFYSDEKI